LSDSTSWSRPRSLSTSSCEARNARDSAATRLPVCTVRANSRELAAGPVREAEGAFARVRASSWVSDTPAMGVRGVVVELGSGVPVARWYQFSKVSALKYVSVVWCLCIVNVL
jgi:hypothetical protein